LGDTQHTHNVHPDNTGAEGAIVSSVPDGQEDFEKQSKNINREGESEPNKKIADIPALSESALAEKVRRSMETAHRWDQIAGRA
jgi:hypothetical protein